jgi:hypothetical protein
MTKEFWRHGNAPSFAMHQLLVIFHILQVNVEMLLPETLAERR